MRSVIIFFLAVGILSTSSSSLSKLDMKGSVSGTGFNFKYTGIVSTGNEVMPLVGQLSKDGLKMYFTSQNFAGEKQLFVMKREKQGDSFGKPIRLKGTINNPGYDIIMPSLSADEKIMVFVNSVDGTQKGNELFITTRDEQASNDLFISTRVAEDGPFVNVRSLDEINDPELSDSYPYLSNDGLRIYFTKQKGSEITFHVAERNEVNARFSKPKKLEFNLPKISNNMSCFFSQDELEIFALSGDKIYHARRESINGKFSMPIEIGQSGDENGYMSGISMTQDNTELFVFNSIGFRNTQILRFVNTEAGKSEKPKVTVTEKQSIQDR